MKGIILLIFFSTLLSGCHFNSNKNKFCFDDISISHQNGILSHGTEIQIKVAGNKKVYYEFEGKKPDKNSPVITNEFTFLHQKQNSKPIWGSQRTTVDKAEDLPHWINTSYAISDHAYQKLKSVNKHTVLALKVEGCAEVRYYQWIDTSTLSKIKHMPILLISANADSLYGNCGILVEGDYCPVNKRNNTEKLENYDWNNWKYDMYSVHETSIVEKFANVVIVDNQKVIKDGWAKVKVSGFSTSFSPYKSLTIEFPKKEKLKSPDILPGVEEYASVYLRNWQNNIFLDDVVSNKIVYDQNIGAQNSTLCALFINGEFNGLRNFYEKQNNSFVKSHFDLKKKRVARFSYSSNGISLKSNATTELEQYCINKYHTLQNLVATTKNYNSDFVSKVKNHLDTESFFKVRLTESILGKLDNNPNNTRLFWSSKDSLFHEMIKDYDNTMIVDYLNANDFRRYYIENKNYPQRSLLMSNFLKSTTLRNEYLNTACDMLSSCFTSREMLNVLNESATQFGAYLNIINSRWGHLNNFYFSKNLFENRVNEMREYLSLRREIVIHQLMTDFNIDTTNVYLSIDADNNCSDSTYVKIHSLKIKAEDDQWKERISFTNIPVTVEAVGQNFIGWEGYSLPQKFTMNFNSDSTYYFKAIFDCK